MMYFDVNVSSECRGVGQDVLEELGVDGVCVSSMGGLEVLGACRTPPAATWGDKKVYRRAEVGYGGELCDGAWRGEGVDLVAISVSCAQDLRKAIEACPDVVVLDGTKGSWLRKQDVVEAVKRNVFFEVPLVYGLYGWRDKGVWMRNVRRVLAVTEGVNVVVGSGATCSTEMKSWRDVVRILDGLGVSRDMGRRVVMNSARLVRSCDARKGSFTWGGA